MPDRYAAAIGEAATIAEAILQAEKESRNEAELRGRISIILADFATRNGVHLETREEYTLGPGRVDTIYNRLIVEYKAPGTLSKSRQHRASDSAILQARGYLESLQRESPRGTSRAAGIVLDGRLIVFIRVTAAGFRVDPPVDVTPQSIEILLRLLISLNAGVAILPEQLVADFGIHNRRAKQTIATLYDSALRSDNPLVRGLFKQWELYFSEVAGYEVGSPRFLEKAGVRELLKALDIRKRDVEPARLFFALHTYYALLIKLIAWLAISPYLGQLGTSFGHLASVNHEELRNRLKKLERGGIFRELGITNFLEGDFFGWYLLTWDDSIASVVRDVVVRLGEYDPGTLALNPEGTRDLLKRLYQFLMPREVRHDLGEYYTPDWLAQLTLNRLEGLEPLHPFAGDPTKRLLDPACGSGTFLVLAINAIKKRCQEDLMPEAEVLDAIVKGVVGIDLNPLAVIAARTNYLLAIQELLPHRTRELAIPIYLADSVLIPSPSDEVDTYGNLLVPTAVGVFSVPPAVVSKESMETVANLLDECIESGVSVESFLARAEASLPTGVYREASNGLRIFYLQILDLHEKGLDGIWSRVLKNAFAPLFIGNEFDYIVGNPPWINWESLPDEYRLRTKAVWKQYGLFPHGGMDTILGKGKKDISMLMTYAVIDRHLKDGGELAFVITQTLFKTTGAAQGFRRFKLGSSSPIRVLHVDDLSDLNPFEGATNRTAVMLIQKGAETKYPVPYRRWTKIRSRPPMSPDSTLRQLEESASSERLIASPVDANDPTSAWLTLPNELQDVAKKVFGESKYRAYAGANSGGANAVYWVEIAQWRPDGIMIVTNLTDGARRKVEQVEAAIEPDLVYPLLRGRDVSRWNAAPSAHIILAQNPSTRRGLDQPIMERSYPKTYSYLKRFETSLRDRAAFRRYFTRKGTDGRTMETAPFYSMFNIGEYTLSEWKVVWREQAASLTAAVVGPAEGKPVIPDHKLMLVPCKTPEEAQYVCAFLNSLPVRLVVQGYASSIAMDTHIISRLRMPKWDEQNPVHRSLSNGFAEVRRAVIAGDESTRAAIERGIDEAVAQILGLTHQELLDTWRIAGQR